MPVESQKKTAETAASLRQTVPPGFVTRASQVFGRGVAIVLILGSSIRETRRTSRFLRSYLTLS